MSSFIFCLSDEGIRNCVSAVNPKLETVISILENEDGLRYFEFLSINSQDFILKTPIIYAFLNSFRGLAFDKHRSDVATLLKHLLALAKIIFGIILFLIPLDMLYV